jgi:putative membrane protein
MISRHDRARIAVAIKTAEQKTSGEIVCVLMHAASEYNYAPALWAAFVALVSPWALVAFTQLSVFRVLAVQIAVFIVALAILSLRPLRFALVPRTIKRTRAHRAAMEQFFSRGVTQTRDRMGVLIFVSLAEHYAHVVADEGVAARVDQHAWREAVDMLTAHIREGRVADGFIAAIGKCGAVLAEHAPPDGSTPQLPDRIYVL